MSIDSDVLERMIVEIATGKEPAVPDSSEEAVMRLQLKQEIQVIQASGHDVDVPHEVSDIE